ncbi:trissin receptor isoform X2 [Drosophila innubila]|uniref:trissin receptor isoform X2 n=1 Tax=Drosophila innubila TaxID=198719 RepID=UPI00148DE214|nr:trissin receptor isoform X2 [Drosophila innubila]
MSARILQWTSSSWQRQQRQQQQQRQRQQRRQWRRRRQETEAAQRREHKQLLQNGSTNISAAYDDDNDDDENENEPHNQSSLNNNNISRSLFSTTSSYSISGLCEWKQQQQPQQQRKQHQEKAVESTAYTHTRRFPLLLPLPMPLSILLLLLVDCSLARTGNYSFRAVNLSDSEVGLLFNESSTAAVAPPTTAVTVSQDSSKELAVDDDDGDNTSEYIFDRTDVRIIFITLYSIVFCCCFFGNLLVILVVTLSRRLRSITNFFLANLAFADFCVGLFCVMQNLSIYLIDSWVFGEFLCRMYQFVHSLSYTASIFILVVICMERYFAIVHPITCKQILTAARLRMVIVTVWITSAVYSTPKFVFSKTIKNIHTEDGQEEEICVLDREMFNSKLLDIINFVLLYVMPLLVMTVLYSKIAIALWRSSRGFTSHVPQQHQNHQQHGQETSMSLHNSMYHHHPHPHQHAHHHQLHQLPAGAGTTTAAAGGGAGGGGGAALASGSSSASLSRKLSSKYEKRGVSITESQVSLEADRPIVSACRKTSFYHHSHTHNQRGGGANGGGGTGGGATHMSHSSSNVLRARRGVVRMLIIFVLTFALCNLPYHARKMWQYWSRSYRGDSNFNALLTPLTFLVTYFNSGVNPLLYAFLSRNFRKGMKELLLCSWKKGKGKSSSNSSMHHKRKALQTHSLPTDTTHIGNEQL